MPSLDPHGLRETTEDRRRRPEVNPAVPVGKWLNRGRLEEAGEAGDLYEEMGWGPQRIRIRMNPLLSERKR